MVKGVCVEAVIKVRKVEVQGSSPAHPTSLSPFFFSFFVSAFDQTQKPTQIPILENDFCKSQTTFNTIPDFQLTQIQGFGFVQILVYFSLKIHTVTNQKLK